MNRQKERYSLRLNVKFRFFSFLSICDCNFQLRVESNPAVNLLYNLFPSLFDWSQIKTFTTCSTNHVLKQNKWRIPLLICCLNQSNLVLRHSSVGPALKIKICTNTLCFEGKKVSTSSHILYTESRRPAKIAVTAPDTLGDFRLN